MRVLTRSFRLLALAAVLSAVACSNNDTAIFYYLENEERVVDYSLDNESTILGMADAGLLYFVSLGGSIWQRPDSAPGDWTKVALPADARYCGPLVAFLGNLYTGVDDGPTVGLFSAAPGPAPSWALVTDADLSGGKQVTGLFVAGAELFVSTLEAGGTFSLYHSADGTAFAATGISGRNKPITQVAWDGANYYAAVGTQLLRGLAGSITTDVTPPTATDGIFMGVYFSPTYSKVYAATDADYVGGPSDGGRIFETADSGTTWGATGEVTDSGDVRFTRIGEAGGNILIGTMEHGLYQLQGGSVASRNRLPDTTDTDLLSGTVRDFFVNGTSVFALTAGSGLWRADTAPAFQDWNWILE